ncbi:MAG: hypothetical protein JF622_17435, partial [Terrabacter sp.]|nr:hypothetical protein [Terrabacter sp.]
MPRAVGRQLRLRDARELEPRAVEAQGEGIALGSLRGDQSLAGQLDDEAVHAEAGLAGCVATARLDEVAVDELVERLASARPRLALVHEQTWHPLGPLSRCDAEPGEEARGWGGEVADRGADAGPDVDVAHRELVEPRVLARQPVSQLTELEVGVRRELGARDAEGERKVAAEGADLRDDGVVPGGGTGR